MRPLDPDLSLHLAGGATTLAWCWRLRRRDGTVLGFTDHDRDLTVDGTHFEAAGFTASDIEQGVGLAVDNLEIAGALTSERLSADALASGLYDDATIDILRVNWAAPEQFVLVRRGSLGEVKRSLHGFTAEVRGLAHYLQQPQGRLFQYTCDADLGDRRCGIDLEEALYRATTSISALLSPRRFLVSGLESYAAQWFARGRLAVVSGAGAGGVHEIKRHDAGASGEAIVELWQEPAVALSIGDAVVVVAGCDKHLATCRAKFANVVNFRGFPFMPGNDAVTRIARQGGT